MGGSKKGRRHKTVYPDEGKRRCSNCTRVLPIEEFYARNKRPEEGHSSWCRECVIARMRKNRLKKRLAEGREKLVEWIGELKRELKEAKQILEEHDSGG